MITSDHAAVMQRGAETKRQRRPGGRLLTTHRGVSIRDRSAKSGQISETVCHIANFRTFAFLLLTTLPKLSGRFMIGRYYPWFLLCFLSLVWGSSFILIKRGLVAFTPMQVGALRMVMAGAVLLPFGLVQLRRVKREYFKYILFVGVIGNAIPAVLFSEAEMHLNSSVAGVLNALQPLFTLLIGVFAFGLVIYKRQYAGVALGFAGAFLMAARSNPDGNLQDNLLYGLMIVFATVLYGLSVNIIRHKLQAVKAVQITSISLPAVAIPSLVYLLSTDFVHRLQTMPEAPASFGYIAILGVIGTALAVSLFNRLIQMRGLMMATSIPYTLPIVATFWGLLDNEPIGVIHIVGMLVILVGVYLVNSQAAPKETRIDKSQ